MPLADKKKRNASTRKKTSHAQHNVTGYTRCEEDQVYGMVTNFTGGSYVDVFCTDQVTRRCHIRGRLQRFKASQSQRIHKGDIVLVSIRTDIQDKTGDVLQKYSPEEVKYMRKEGVLQALTEQLNQNEEKQQAEDIVEFCDFETL